MKLTHALVLTALGAMAAMSTTLAETISFDQDPPGAAPAGWRAGVTGRGSPKWLVEADTTAPSKPNVLKQSGSGTFPWCVRPDATLADGYVEVKFKAISGKRGPSGRTGVALQKQRQLLRRPCQRSGKQRVALLHAERPPQYAQGR